MDDNTPSWHVDADGMHEDTTLHPSGQGLQTRWLVPYVIDSGPAKGTRHTVAVAPADFTGEGVRQALIEHANNVHQVAQLRSAGA
jgi:hypothetical protein